MFPFSSLSFLRSLWRALACVVTLSFVMSCSEKAAQDARSEIKTGGPGDDVTSLRVSSGIMKELPPGVTVGAIYLKIENNSDKTAMLTYVHSDRAEKIEVHRHIYNDGMMQMRNVPHLSVDPKTALEFKPGEYHLMAFGMSSPPKAGESFDVTFEFAGFPALVLPVKVEKP